MRDGSSPSVPSTMATLVCGSERFVAGRISAATKESAASNAPPRGA